MTRLQAQHGQNVVKAGPGSSVVHMWHDSLGFLSTSQALCVAAKALRTESRTELTQFALPLVLLFSASTAIRSWNPIAWAARPYKIVRCRGRGMSSPIADQCVSHLGESAMGVLMCCYGGDGGQDEPRLYLWLSVLIAAVARGVLVRRRQRLRDAARGREACWAARVHGRHPGGPWATRRSRSSSAAGRSASSSSTSRCTSARPSRTRSAATARSRSSSRSRPPVDDSYDTWKDDMPWLTLYFVLGPWAALVLYQRIAETPWLL
ncbi:VDE lipocalin domain-containing protein [Aureococcus anophagefferens]|nr:VDE lipocalin domain-containing protein [Aureococcus anophagefferens]